MKKNLIFIFFLLIILLTIPSVFADGMMHIKIHDEDMWGLFNQEKQFCAINYKDGFQNMILTVDTSEELRGEKAVWIFPVPAKPEKTVINILKAFPTLQGHDVEEEAEDVVEGTFLGMMATQVYPFPLLLLTGASFAGNIEDFSQKTLGIEGVTIHETIEKMGLTTELITATDGNALSSYLMNKDLNLPENSISILNEYIGQEYSFVISWISDIEEFKRQQPLSYVMNLINKGKISEVKEFINNYAIKVDSNEDNYILYQINRTLNRGRDINEIQDYLKHLGRYTTKRGNSIGVFISFPTEKIYYPLKPTSVYGSLRVPAVIYVLDYVIPELYIGIKADSEVKYFFENYYRPNKELKDFFFGQEKIENLKYTKININPPSKYLTQDLWFEISTPFRVKFANFISRFSLYWGLLLFIILSCLASLIAGLIVFRKTNISKSKYFFFGLFNFLTLIGFSIATYFLKTKEVSQKVKQIISKEWNNIFDNSKKKYYIFFFIYLFLIITIVLVESNLFRHTLRDMLGIVLIFGIPFTLFTYAFIPKICSEKVKDDYRNKLTEDNYELNIVDLKKVFLFLLFLVLALIFYFIAEGFYYYIAMELFFTLLFISISIPFLIIIIFDNFVKRKFGFKLYYIVPKDLKKLWFIILFTIIFMVLNVSSLLVFKLII